MKYETLHSSDIKELDSMINEKLYIGWDLYGDLIVVDGSTRIFYQGMVLMVTEDFV